MNRIIKIEQGNELKVLVNSQDIKEDDFFFPQYVEARRHITTIVESTEKIAEFNCDEEYLNNIIAFCGERGAGKTTAMKTFAQLLCQEKETEFFSSFKDTAFHALKSIDPSSFESMHHVLDFIISLMFKDFEYTYRNKPDDINNDLKYRLLSQFQIVYKNLSALRNPKRYQDLEYDYEGDVQKLSNIASDINLRENLYKLIADYLKMKKSKYLVLMIDDIDINAQFAYEITEELRRYLNIPNVIIIMAIRMEQLNYCIKKELKKDFNSLIEENKKYIIELNTMVNKYLNKLIPESRRIQLPDLRIVSSDAKDLIEIKYFKSTDNAITYISDLTSKENEKIETTILKHIYNMTDIVFVHEQSKIHPIIPSTLRELVMLYVYLGQMKKDSKQENIILLKQYFDDVWCKNNLNEYTSKIVMEWDAKPLMEKNQFICEQIKKVIEAFVSKEDDILKNFKSDSTIIYEANMKKVFNSNAYINRQSDEYAFSLGEVLNLLMDVNTIVKNDELDNLVSACYMMYSILLNQLKGNNKIHTGEGIMEPDDVNTIIAGSIWGNKLVELLPRVMQPDGERLSRCRFNYDIFNVLSELAGYNEGLQDNTDSKEIEQSIWDSSITKVEYEKIMKKASDQLFVLGSVSKFGLKGKPCEWRETCFSDNYAIKTNVEFHLDGLFTLGMNVPFVREKVSYDSTLSISKNVDVNELLDKYGIDKMGSEYIVYNIELSKFILSECLKRKAYSREASSEDQLGHFHNLFKTVNRVLEEVLYLLDKKVSFITKEDAEGSIYEIIHLFYRNRMNGTESKAFGALALPKLNVRSASYKTYATQLLSRCNDLLVHLNANIESLENVKSHIEKIENMIVDLKKIDSNMAAPKECIDDYNLIFKIVKAFYKR